LRQAGFNWLVIFSLSGHWALLVTLLISLYLFAIFRGIGKEDPDLRIEHSLTSTTYYMAFYVSAPLLGTIAGVLGMMGETKAGPFLGGITLGTIGATFLTWVVVDPLAGSLELLTPQARKHLAERLAHARLRKEQEQANRDLLLTRILKQEQDNEGLWQQMLAPQAKRLADLLAPGGIDFTEAEQKAIRIGVEAWRIGGLGCMKQLRNMAAEAFEHQYSKDEFVDYVSVWWDGIGRWRNPSPVLR
jgi:hypothetical protein